MMQEQKDNREILILQMRVDALEKSTRTILKDINYRLNVLEDAYREMDKVKQ